MNNIAISPHIFMYALQNQNVEHKIAKQIDIKKLNQQKGEKETETTNISELASISKVIEGESTNISELEICKNEESNDGIKEDESNVIINESNQFVSAI
jgi:hypothetical protein